MLQETLELDATAEDDLRRQYHELAELGGFTRARNQKPAVRDPYERGPA